MGDLLGAVIEVGPADWQIVQQDDHGFGSISVSGQWYGRPESVGSPFVQVRLVHQDTATPVLRSLDWQHAQMHGANAWSATLTGIPAGGLYRLETRLEDQAAAAYDWAVRGDMRHCLGVGDLWVIAGQSNSAGYGRGPVYDPAELGIHLYRNNGKWALATHPFNESTDTVHNVNRETSNPGHSPYLNFARVLRRHLGYPIGLIQTSLGGSPLSRWNPTEPGDSDLFDSMVTCVQAVGGATGVLWYQGESDCDANQAATYGSRFAAAVSAWRTALDNPKLAVVTVQLNRVLGTDRTGDRLWSIVREAQRQAARSLDGVAVIPAHDQPLTDMIHISPAGNMVLGDRLARASLQSFYNRDVDGAVPDLTSAEATENRESIDLRFANVSSFLNALDTAAKPYDVQDADGPVDVVGISYPDASSVLLQLGRPLSGAATVSGGSGVEPQALPIDMQRILPVLAFHEVAVTG